MPLILGTNSIKDTGYEVANSCRFNSGDNCKISRTSPNSSPTDSDKFTFSCWVKRSNIDADSGHQFQQIFDTYDGSGAPEQEFQIYFTDNALRIQTYNSSNQMELVTNRLFRDTSAWYSIIFSYDSSPSTPSASSVRLWINGVLETSFSAAVYPSQNTDGEFAIQNHIQMIGNNSANARDFGGYLAEVIGVDGQALVNTDFGEFDEDSPTIWKPIDVSGINVGTLGFYCDFEDSGTLGNDVSGVGDFTVANLAAVDQATDTPTNNFATLNSLQTVGTTPTLSEGNLKITIGSTNWVQRTSTIAANSGKWYAECKVKNISSTYGVFGIIGVEDLQIGRLAYPHGAITGVGFTIDYRSGQSTVETPAGAQLSNEVDIANDDILGFAMDLDNGKLYWHKNGTYINSGDPTSGATGTGAINVHTAGLDYYISYAVYNGAILDANFGNSIDALSSAVADGDGYGAFEYAPPSGYYALCTKNLAEYG